MSPRTCQYRLDVPCSRCDRGLACVFRAEAEVGVQWLFDYHTGEAIREATVDDFALLRNADRFTLTFRHPDLNRTCYLAVNPLAT